MNSEVWGIGHVTLSGRQDIQIEFWWVNLMKIYELED